jgi:putative membrane protein
MTEQKSPQPVTPEPRLEDGEVVLREASFDNRYVTYSMLAFTIVMVCTCVGVAILPFYLPFAAWFHKKQLERVRLVLTERSLKVERGVMNRIEKTIPLDKITDLALFQGPIMRSFELEGLRVETAGQSSGTGASLVNLIGVIEARAFREAVLAQRDALAAGTVVRAASPDAAQAVSAPGGDAVLRDIRDAVLRIEKKLDDC